MEYGIRELSEMAGVSARTLRYYDEIGLLKPLYTTEAGYRFYGEREVALLQQILFFRERKFDLKSIQKILYQDDFDVMHALEEHLAELEYQREHVEALIRTVKQTIQSMKGECEMSDREKFEALKENAVKKNEEKYGAEIREKYGNVQIDASNQTLLNMTEGEWEEFQRLEAEILKNLKKCVLDGSSPESEAAKEVVVLHKKWLCGLWKRYTPKMHKGTAQLYTVDERFAAYYDREVSGCAKFLEQAISRWADRI